VLACDLIGRGREYRSLSCLAKGHLIGPETQRELSDVEVQVIRTFVLSVFAQGDVIGPFPQTVIGPGRGEYYRTQRRASYRSWSIICLLCVIMSTFLHVCVPFFTFGRDFYQNGTIISPKERFLQL